MTKFLTTTALSLAIFAATQATATTYQHQSPNSLNGVNDATFTYSDTTDWFSLSFETIDTDNVDGFWFVVNDGPQPLWDDAGDLAIFYSDLTDIWAYQYTGWDGGVNDSYEGTLLEKFTGAVTSVSDAGKTTFEMLLNLSDINGAGLTADWTGLAFDTTIGTWLHPTRNTFDTCGGTYEVGGDLACFKSNNWLGWDEKNKTAAIVDDSLLPPAVPLPASFGFLALGLAGMGALRRRKS